MRKLFGLILCLSFVALLTGTAAAVNEPIIVAKAGGAVTVDGNLTDWAGVPAYYVSSSWKTAGAALDSDDDLSAFAMLQYDDKSLYVAVRVIDESLIFDRDARHWENDCVEIWLAGQQYGLTLSKAGQPVVADWKNWGLQGATSAVVPVAGGYVVEAQFTLESVEKAIGSKIASGTSFQLAIGIDDADDDANARDSQIYYPVSWVHSNPSSFATATFQ